jgi:hypothetical protein
MSKTAWAALSLAAVCAVSLVAERQPASQAIEKAFAKGGTVRFDLAAGDYRITGRTDDRIRVEWRSDRPEEVSRVKVNLNVTGPKAFITTELPKNNHIRFTIDLPMRSDVDIDLSAGDLDVRGLEGSKKIESWAGDIAVDVGRRDLYRTIEASVRAGDLRAEPFSYSTGGLFRSFRWSGAGTHTLSVKLMAGDLTLR